MSLLVLGAGGFLGLNTVDAMHAQGLAPRCGRRRRSNVLGLRERNARLVEADLDRPLTLGPALRGCRTVVHLAGHYPKLSNRPFRSLRKAVAQTRTLLEAAARAGVQRLIFVSSTATVAARPDGASTEDDVFSESPGFGTYHGVKWQMEALVSAERRFETVTVCPGACLGPFDWKIGTSAMLFQLLRGQCPPHPDGVVSWVDARDVACALARLVEVPKPPPRLLLAAHSGRFHEFLRFVARRYQVAEVPPALAPAVAIALADAEEARAEKDHVRPSLSREVADLIVHGAAIDASRSRQVLSLAYRPLEESLEAFERWAKRMGTAVSTRNEVHR